MHTETKSKKPQCSFSNATIANLRQYFTIHKVLPKAEFEQWAAFPYPWQAGEKEKLSQLAKQHQLYLKSYTEAALQIKFLGIIYHYVNFIQPAFQDFYQAFFKAEFEQVILSGYPDMMVAKGDLTPELPYFFIQEFKSSKPDKEPEYQVLAAMIAAIHLNQTDELWGGYITGAIWNFMIVRKVGDNAYEYTVDESLNSLKASDLQRIFVMLQAVKARCVSHN